MNATLVRKHTGERVPVGGQLHTGAGQHYRHEGVHSAPRGDSSGLIHVSRLTRQGRLTRVMPPHLFNCKLLVQGWQKVVDSKRVERLLAEVARHFGDLAAGGIIALIIAVFFARYLGITP